MEGNTYFIPQYAIHRPAVKNFLKGQLYEPLTHKFVNEYCGQFKGSIIHAGTFFGDMIPSFSSSVNGKVFAFEPVLENFILANDVLEAPEFDGPDLKSAALLRDDYLAFIKDKFVLLTGEDPEASFKNNPNATRAWRKK